MCFPSEDKSVHLKKAMIKADFRVDDKKSKGQFDYLKIEHVGN